MNSIRQHRPSWVETTERPSSGCFETIEQLEQIPFVSLWKTTPGFVRFSQSEELLMAEMKNGYMVVGYIKYPDKVMGLPTWIKPQDKNV